MHQRKAALAAGQLAGRFRLLAAAKFEPPAIAMAGRRGKRWLRDNRSSKQMVEIGRFTPVSKEQNYIPGQFFLHAQKGYRGVIVCPCTLNLYDSGGETGAFDSELVQTPLDSDAHSAAAAAAFGGAQDGSGSAEPSPEPAAAEAEAATAPEDVDASEATAESTPASVLARRTQFYQILRDERDYTNEKVIGGDGSPLSSTSTNQPLQTVAAVSNFDYVDHRDILPYVPKSHRTGGYTETAFRNDKFKEFFQTVSLSPDEKGRDLAIAKTWLTNWANEMTTIFRHSAVFRTQTNNVQVSVLPVFYGTFGKNENKEWTWLTKVSISNLGDEPIKILDRLLYEVEDSEDNKYKTRITEGMGVVGSMHKIRAHESVNFVSSIKLGHPSGYYHGVYRGQVTGHLSQHRTAENQDDAESADVFDVRIPHVRLYSPDALDEAASKST